MAKLRIDNCAKDVTYRFDELEVGEVFVDYPREPSSAPFMKIEPRESKWNVVDLSHAELGYFEDGEYVLPVRATLSVY